MTFHRASVGEVRRSSSATAAAVFGRRAASAHRSCHNGVDYEPLAIWHVASPGGGPSASAEIIPCCNVRTAERAPLQCPLRKRTTARNWPIAHHLRVLVARRLRNVRYRSMTRALLLRDDCVMEESGRNACAKSIQNLVEFRLESLQLHRYATLC